MMFSDKNIRFLCVSVTIYTYYIVLPFDYPGKIKDLNQSIKLPQNGKF